MTDKHLIEAAALDAADRPVEAAAAYERALAEGGASLDVHLDLIAIYLASQDFGYQAQHRLSDDFIRRADARYWEVLDTVESRFGSSDMIEFWRRYYRWFAYGEHEEQGPALRKIYEHGQVLEACVVADDADLARLVPRLRALYQLCKDGRTERTRYFRSLAESGLRLAGASRDESL